MWSCKSLCITQNAEDIWTEKNKKDIVEEETIIFHMSLSYLLFLQSTGITFLTRSRTAEFNA